jgi:hypothetical protein
MMQNLNQRGPGSHNIGAVAGTGPDSFPSAITLQPHPCFVLCSALAVVVCGGWGLAGWPDVSTCYEI